MGEPLGTINFELNNRSYVVKIYTNDCSIYPWVGFIYDDLNKCHGKTTQATVDDLKQSAIDMIQSE